MPPVLRNRPITTPTSSTLICPVPTCGTSLIKRKHNLIRSHLLSHEPSDLRCIPTSYFTEAEVFKCPLCPTSDMRLFSSKPRLTTHIKTDHKTTTRSITNSELILTHFSPDPTIINLTKANWRKSLSYFHKLDVIPFSFRRSIYNKINKSTKKDVRNMAFKLFYITSIANQPHIDSRNLNVPPQETTSSALWKMLLLFEGMMLAPPSGSEPRNYNSAVMARIKLLQRGSIDLVHQSAASFRTPPSYSIPSDESRSESIISAANSDNWRKASKLLKTPLPPIPFDADHLPQILELHPPPTPYIPPNPIQRPTSSFHTETYLSSNEAIRNRLHDDHLMLKTLRKMARDTAAGPFADSTDFLRDIFLQRSAGPEADDPTYDQVKVLILLLKYIYTGDIPKDIRPLLAFNESAAFQKKPTDPKAVRPIGIGVAWRRIAAAHAVFVSRDHIASLLAPTQFAIGLHAGLDMITHTMQTHVRRFLPSSHTSSNSSRVILLLDLANMFNSISMVRARELIHAHLPHLLPLFDILYFHPSHCWYRDCNGERHSFMRQEGSSQGCPFAALLACLVMNDVIKPLNHTLSRRAAERKRRGNAGDDGLGSHTVLMSYIDDCTLSIPYEDLRFFVDEFNRIGRPLGCLLKSQKCQILTSTAGTSPLSILPQNHRDDILYVLNNYCGGQTAGEATDGVRILGAPIGNDDFVACYQNKSIRKLQDAITSIHNLLSSDPHISTSLYKFSLQHYISHLIPVDILHNNNISSSYKQYLTPFLTTITSMTRAFLLKMTSNPDINDSILPMHAWYIASTPAGMGGLGFDDPATKSIKSFLTPLIRIIRSTHHGMMPQLVQSPNLSEHASLKIDLPKYITISFRSWKTSSLPIFQKLRDLTNQYVQNIEIPALNPTGNPLLDYILHTPIAATNKNVQHGIYVQRMKDLWPTLDPQIQKFLPSTMSTMTSVPMSNVSRADPSNRMKYDEFKIYMQRKLRLPLWPKQMTCLCGAHVDDYGDHYFTCRHAHKTALHHSMRDALFLICKNIMPLVSETTKEDVLLEQPHLFDSATQMRPGDVVVLHPLQTRVEPHSATLIDVTIIPPFKAPPDTSSFSGIAERMLVHHTKYEYDKFKLKDNLKSNTSADQLAQEAVAKRYRLLPFTIDHTGMLGPIASEFLCSQKNPLFKVDDIQYTNPRTSVPISKLISFAQHNKRHKNIFSRADAVWKATYGNKWYTNTHHAQTPSQWAKQVLGNTFSIHSSRHILRAMHKIHIKNTYKTPSSTKKPNLQCCSTNLYTPSNYAVRSLRQQLISPT